jgi:hypothetical protein
MGPARQRHRRPALLLWPTRQPLPSPSIRSAVRARRTSRAPAGFGPLPVECHSPVGGDPLLVPRFLNESATLPDPVRFLLPSASFKKGTRRCRPKCPPPHAAISSSPLLRHAAATSLASAASHRASPSLIGSLSSPPPASASASPPSLRSLTSSRTLG